MNFRIADTFTDSLTKLTGEEQKAVKTTAFDLQMNPANPGMSFHKLDKARDKNFWSVRVSSDIRLIVHKTDDNLMLCYEDHHDNAYDWAARRKLETHAQTGAAQLVEIRETVQEIVIPKYVEVLQFATPKPRLFAHAAEEVLLSYGVPEEWLPDVQQADEDSPLNQARQFMFFAITSIYSSTQIVAIKMKNIISIYEKRIHGAFQLAIARKLRACFGAVMALVFLLVSPMASSTGFTVYTTISPMTGLWWNQNESGWGVGLTQQYGVIFATLYTYDFEGRPTWYVASNCVVAADGCTGDLYAVTGGSPLTVPWNGANKIVTAVGTINFAFTDTNTGTMNYTINGVAGSRAITRQIFATEPIQPGQFPFDFKDVRLNSMAFSLFSGIICQATLSITNESAVAVSPVLYFDVIVDGVAKSQVSFFTFGLAPAASVTAVAQPVISNGSYLACGTFTLRFNSSASQVH